MSGRRAARGPAALASPHAPPAAACPAGTWGTPTRPWCRPGWAPRPGRSGGRRSWPPRRALEGHAHLGDGVAGPDHRRGVAEDLPAEGRGRVHLLGVVLEALAAHVAGPPGRAARPPPRRPHE